MHVPRPLHRITNIDQLTATEVSELIATASGGDSRAVAQLFPVLYRELHRVAERQLARRGSDLSLGTTTLLHEAYLDLSGRATRFADEAHFMAYASRAMRALIVDYSRRQQAKKRGSEFHITGIGDAEPVLARAVVASSNLDALNDSLDELMALDPRLAELVDLHFFCGFTFTEIGAMRNVTERTVQRDWRKARVMLRTTMLDSEAPAHNSSS